MSRRVDLPGSAPLRGWGDALRRNRKRRRRLARRAAFVVAGCASIIGTIVMPPRPRFVWNASASAPLGLYSVSPATLLHVADMVIAWPPAAVRRLAASRRYLPIGVPLVKRVAAGPGDRICAMGARVSIDGRVVVARASADSKGRPMPTWSGCRWLHDGQYLLLMADVPTSFDGRYFGITETGDIIGRARLLWWR